MADQLLFPEGGWEIHRTGEGTLNKIIPTLQVRVELRAPDYPGRRKRIFPFGAK